jgi:hypothetical protein
MPARRCGVKLRNREGYCRAWPIKGRTVCRTHGGLNLTGPKTPEGWARTLAGSQRWYENQRELKRLGIIKRIPRGWTRTRPGGTYHHYLVDTARKELARMKAEDARVLAEYEGELPAGAESNAQRLEKQLGLAFDVTEKILAAEVEVTEENKGLLRIQKETAVDIIRTNVKVADQRLRSRELDALPELLRNLERARLMKTVDDE